MMDSFVDYIDKVKAEDTLKERTKSYVSARLAAQAGSAPDVIPIKDFKKKHSAVKKLIVTLSSAAACALLVIGGYAFYQNPVSYVSVDINPSVEFGINAFSRVVSADAYNEDGTALLIGQHYINLSLENAVDALVSEAAEQGFIKADGSTVIAVTSETNSDTAASQLQNTCMAGIGVALKAEGKAAVIYIDSINLQLRTRARETGVSPGKYRLIEILQTLNADITLEQYKNAKITDIITAANNMLSGSASGQNGEYAGALERIQNAAEQVQAVYGNSQQVQVKNQGAESAQQEQIQTQNSGTTEQLQVQNQNQASPSPDSTPASSMGEAATGQNSGSTGTGTGNIDTGTSAGSGSGSAGSGGSSAGTQAGNGTGGKS